MSVPSSFTSHLRIRKSTVFAGYTLLLYDYIVTWPLEVEYIWSGPWTLIKIGFLINRYGNLFGQTFVMLEETGYLNHSNSVEFCTIFWAFCPMYMMLSSESIRILVLMRACTIWGCMHRVASFSTVLIVFYILASLATLIYPLALRESLPFLYLQYVHICVLPVPPYYWMSYLTTIGLDSAALVMIWRGLLKLSKESRGLYPSPLIRLLIRDAIVFYVSSLFNGILSIICWSAFREDPRNFLAIGFTFPLISVIGQRIILNLRGFRTRQLTTRAISLEIDRQMADMGNRLWSDLGLETQPLTSGNNDNDGNGGDPSDTDSVDLEVDVDVEIRSRTKTGSGCINRRPQSRPSFDMILESPRVVNRRVRHDAV